MKTNYKFTDTESNDALREYADEKITSFEKLLDEQAAAAAVCDVEFKRDTHHQSGDVCYAEITLETDGKLHRVSKAEPTFEKAIDKVKDDMLASLREDKGKVEDNIRRGGREAKEMLQEGGL